MSYNTDKTAKRTEFGAKNEEEMRTAASTSQSNLLIKRRSLLKSTCESLQYIGSLPRQQFRKSDKISDVLVLACLLCAVMLIALPSSLIRPPVVTLVDFVFLAVIVYFIMSRLGILTSLTPRQAVLVGDIVIGTFLLGILLTFNALYFIASMYH